MIKIGRSKNDSSHDDILTALNKARLWKWILALILVLGAIIYHVSKS